MKKINLPLLLFLVIGSVVAVVGIHLLHGYQVSRNAGRLLARAQKAKEEGDAAEEVRLLERYLRHRPDDVEQMRVLLTDWTAMLLDTDQEDLDGEQIGRLFRAVEKAARDFPNDIELRQNSLKFAMLRGADGVTTAMNQLEHLDRMRDENDQPVLRSEDYVSWAVCHMWLNETDQATKILSDLVGFDPISKTFKPEADEDNLIYDPKELNAYAELLRLYMREGSREENLVLGNAIVDQMIAQNPEDPLAYLLRAGFYQEHLENDERWTKSLADIEQALKLDPNSPNAIRAAALTHMNLGDDERAKELLLDGIEKHPKYFRFYLGLSDIANRQGDQDAALGYINQGLEVMKLHRELLYQRANLELQKGDLAAFKQTLSRLQRRGFSDNTRLGLLKASELMVEGKFVDATRILESLEPTVISTKNEYNIKRVQGLLMQCYKRQNRNDLVVALAARMEESDDPSAKMDQASSLAARGHYAEALGIYEELRQGFDKLSSQDQEILFGRYLDLKVRIQQQRPSEQRDWSEVDALAKVFLGRNDVDEKVKLYFQIRLLMNKGEQAEAAKLAQAGVGKYPGEFDLWMLLVSATADHDVALRILDQVQQRFNDRWEIRVAKAAREIARGGSGVASRLAELEQGKDQFSYVDQLQLNQAFAGFYAQIREYDKAIEMWRALLKEKPDILAIRAMIFDLAYESGNESVMKEMVDDIGTMAGTDAADYLIAEARRTFWQVANQTRDTSALVEVRDLIQKAKSNRSDWAPIYVLSADVYLLQENYQAAIDELRLALEKRPDDMGARQKLAEAYMSAGQLAQAKAVLASLPGGAKRQQDVLREVQILVRENPQAALEKALTIVPADSENATDLLFLAEVQAAAAKPDDAFASVQRAVKADPAMPRAWLRYVTELMQRDQQTEAAAAIKELQVQVAEEDLPLLLGQCYATVGDYEQAKVQYEVGMEKDPSNSVIRRNAVMLYQAIGESERASELLDEIVALGGQSADSETAVNVAWARRTKAQSLNSSGTYRDFQAALKLLEQNATATGKLDGEDLAQWLTFCVFRPEASSRKMAAERLEQLQRERTLTPNERFLLATIYRTDKSWPEAKKIMVDLLASGSSSSSIIATYVGWLIENNELRDAAIWARKLPAGSAEALRYQSILLVRDGKARDAAANLVKIAQEANTPQKSPNLRTVAAILEELGTYNASFYTVAEQQWKRYVQLMPNDVGYLASFYSRVPKAAKLAECLAICESEIAKAIKANQPNTVQGYVNLGLGALRENKKAIPLDSPHYQRVAKWFPAMRQANVDDLAVTWSEIDFYDIRGDVVKLDEMYRAFLERDDASQLQKAAVRNNLAFLLAVSDRGAEALEVIGDAIDDLGPRAEFLDTRAMAYIANREYAKAIADLREAVGQGEATGAMFFHLAVAEFKDGDVAEAVKAMTQAHEMGLTTADLSTPEVTLYEQLVKGLGSELPNRDADLELSSR